MTFILRGTGIFLVLYLITVIAKSICDHIEQIISNKDQISPHMLLKFTPVEFWTCSLDQIASPDIKTMVTFFRLGYQFSDKTVS